MDGYWANDYFDKSNRLRIKEEKAYRIQGTFLPNNSTGLISGVLNTQDFLKLTRNKDLYKDFKNQDTFSDRLIFFLLHFAFFLKVYKENNDKKITSPKKQVSWNNNNIEYENNIEDFKGVIIPSKILNLIKNSHDEDMMKTFEKLNQSNTIHQKIE